MALHTAPQLAKEEWRLAEALGVLARPLRSSGDLSKLIDRIGSAQYVLIGEASHGTSEFYRWRALLTERLIEEKDFTQVVAEGDWAECHAAHRYVMGQEGTHAATVLLQACQRWPSWMWANQETEEFLTWLRAYNGVLPVKERVGFFGLDLYGLWDSLGQLTRATAQLDDDMLRRLVADVVSGFREYYGDAQSYGFAAAHGLHDATRQTERLLAYLDAVCMQSGNEVMFWLAQHAFVAHNAARYYHAMFTSSVASWNVRDTHMADMLDRLVTHGGPHTKTVLWAHNTHVGDARYTDMRWSGETNVGQLLRERHGRTAVTLIGMAAYEGSVLAADAWGESLRHMLVPPARAHSWEHVLHAASRDATWLLSDELLHVPEAMQVRGHRAIGVVYDPQREAGNYVPTTLPLRYDALLYFPQTTALHPLQTFAGEEGELPQLYPVGV